MKTILMVAVAAFGFATQAQATPISNDITCSQAQAQVARYGKIYTRVNGGDVVPIYGFANSCAPQYKLFGVSLVTRNSPSCLVGYKCYYMGR